MPYIKQKKRPELDNYVHLLSKLKLSDYKFSDFLVIVSGEYPNYSVDSAVNALAGEIRDNVLPDGSINYILFRYAKYYIKPSYNNYKNLLGDIYYAIEMGVDDKAYRDEYREAAEWIRIKLLTPYEEKKELENGDV